MHTHGEDSDERRRRRRRRALAALLLFSPWRTLRLPIAVAAHDIDAFFDAADMALDSQPIAKALAGTGLEDAITKLVRAAMIGGFNDGGALVGKKAGSSYMDRANRDAAARAEEVSAQMNKTTGEWLKSDPDHQFALSESRAERAAKFEAAQGYYTGLHQALWGEDYNKEWIPLGDDPCENCLDNADAGIIPMEEMFPSGDYAPLAHLNCMCVLSISHVLEGA